MKKRLPTYVILFVLTFMLFIYEPILMYSTNMDTFWFDFAIMIKPTLLIFGIVFIISCLLSLIFYFINKIFDKNVELYKIIVLMVFVGLIVSYIQGNYLIKNLPVLDGSKIDWSIYGKENTVTWLVLMITCIVTLISIVKFKIDKTIKYAMYISIIIFAMLSISLIVMMINNNAFKDRDKAIVTDKYINNISTNKNFFMLCVDATDSTVFNKVLQENQEYKNTFNDFTYFTDAASYFPYTQESIPHILTGVPDKNENSYVDYCFNAYNNSKLFRLLENKKYKINLYDGEVNWQGKRNYNIRNFISSEEVDLDTKIYFKQEMKYILFKYLPYMLKEYSKIETIDFYDCIKNNKGYNWWSDIYNYKNIKNNPLNKEEGNTFNYMHIEGAHLPFNMDKNLNYIKRGTYEQKVAATLKIIDAYINRIKESGQYDNSVIIILADHGYEKKNKPYNRFNPILFIKGIDEKHELIKSDLPISYVDLQQAYEDLLNDKKSTQLFSNVEKNRIRNVLGYLYLKEDHKIEYEITGVASDFYKFRPTGNVYDR